VRPIADRFLSFLKVWLEEEPADSAENFELLSGLITVLSALEQKSTRFTAEVNKLKALVRDVRMPFGRFSFECDWDGDGVASSQVLWSTAVRRESSQWAKLPVSIVPELLETATLHDVDPIELARQVSAFSFRVFALTRIAPESRQ
jgi:hypothetical protein